MLDSRSSNVRVTWGALSALGLLLTVAPAGAATLSTEAAADLEIVPYVEDLAGPTDVAALPDGRVVVIERTGNVMTKSPGPDDPVEAHIDVNANDGEQGLLGVVADPAFATNHFLYFYASEGDDDNNKHHVLRYQLSDDGKLSERTVVIAMGLRGPANHNGGALDIYQGNLYVGVGDTGANDTPPKNKFSSCLNIANGKVLRVSVAEGMLGQPPADNPLVNEAMVTSCDSTQGDFATAAPEKRIFAWGFRNPFRLWVDRTNGKVWVGDVGETTREEIAVVGSGTHNGYPFWEGTTEYNQTFKPANGGCMGMTPAKPCNPAAYDWARGEGGSSIGGRILDGCGWPAAWKSRYVFGDHEQGKVWTLDVNQARDGVVADSRKDFADTNNVRALRMGTDNALYLVEGNGTVSRVTAKGTTTTANSCPSVNGPDAPAGMGGSGAAGAPATAGNGGSGPATAGAAGAGGSAGSNSAAGSGSDDGGCGCRVAGGGTTSLLALGALSAAFGLALGRRRRRG